MFYGSVLEQRWIVFLTIYVKYFNIFFSNVTGITPIGITKNKKKYFVVFTLTSIPIPSGKLDQILNFIILNFIYLTEKLTNPLTNYLNTIAKKK